jgi:hypothetical protein
MSILKQKWVFFNQILPHVPKQLTHLFHFGFWALTTERVTSMRGNARQIVANPHTAKTKAWRLLKNRKWTHVMPHVLVHLQLITSQSIVCLDFSDFHGWQILTFAIQTHQGRAIPVYFEMIKYPITEDSQNIFVVEAIERLVSLVGFRPKLIMDRGFACPHILNHLAQVSHLFVVRVKSIKEFHNWRNRVFKARGTRKNDQVMRGYKHQLRLVVSDKLTGMKQPWYLVTNDFSSTREAIITDYYHRFEIEEFFKDAKWLLGLEWVRFLKAQSMSVVLWFVILGLWFLYTIETNTPTPLWKNHHHLSFNRYWYETMQREKNQLAAVYLQGKEVFLYASQK